MYKFCFRSKNKWKNTDTYLVSEKEKWFGLYDKRFKKIVKIIRIGITGDNIIDSWVPDVSEFIENFYIDNTKNYKVYEIESPKIKQLR